MSNDSVKAPELPGAKAFNLAGLIAYQEGAIVSRVLLKRDKGNVALFAFDKDQGLSEHTTPYDALVHVVDGNVEITIAGKPVAAQSGDVVLLPANQPHALRGISAFKMVLTMMRD